ncbi:MAG: sigma-70 family RNA polymerase sigma factor [Defluviitaleaceae bacterium]|nr:sigma-70 family RNA polymerase sigma factor [Defluviitaleaceae bacterium]MCL2274031.1 sigma-70 family RNA polymerase sigma factor [Defluviitaleaceae bacterium]MCL2274068.1 sigma-70 family RNA polymerase sigma factor [Defluviitaleaceae bacterium]
MEHTLTEGESRAFEKTYARVKDMCAAIATHITRDIALAEDVVQATFVKIMEHKEKYFSLPPQKRDAYIVVMVKNRAIDALRSRRDLSLDNIDENGLTPAVLSDIEKRYEEKEGYTHLLALIKTLPPLYQVVFEMRYIEGLSNKEIAELLDVKQETVVKQLARAREKMKKKINVKTLIVIIITLFAVSAVVFNDEVRAATVGRFVEWWQNHFFIHFHGADSDEVMRHYFWQPAYVPEGFRIAFNEFSYDREMGAFSHVLYEGEGVFSLFSANWMWWINENASEVSRGFPIDGVAHKIFIENGIEYHVFVEPTGEVEGLGGFPVSIFWEYSGFMFQLLGNAEPDVLAEMAFSVVRFDMP